VPAIRGGDLARHENPRRRPPIPPNGMVVELKDKLAAIAAEAEKPPPLPPHGVEADVKSALVNLATTNVPPKPPSPEARRRTGLPASNNFSVLLCQL